MRAKKTATRSSRSVRYLLSADRKLQRLSLKKMAGPAKKAKATALSGRSAPPKESTQAGKQSAEAARQSAHVWLSGQRATIVAVLCVLGAAVLIGVRQPSRPADDVAEAQPAPLVPAEPPTRAPEELRTHTAPRPEPKKTIVPKAVDTTPAVATRNARTAATSTASFESRETPPTPIAAKPAVESPRPPAPEPAPKPVVDDAAAPVTITGCLQVDDDTFWLRDPSGNDAPTQRSWKSGFLKKRPAPIELVGSTGALKLSSYVGQRVSATGTLVNRELHPRSVHRVAASCD